jgi:hypothetical protein
LRGSLAEPLGAELRPHLRQSALRLRLGDGRADIRSSPAASASRPVRGSSTRGVAQWKRERADPGLRRRCDHSAYAPGEDPPAVSARRTPPRAHPALPGAHRHRPCGARARCRHVGRGRRDRGLRPTDVRFGVLPAGVPRQSARAALRDQSGRHDRPGPRSSRATVLSWTAASRLPSWQTSQTWPRASEHCTDPRPPNTKPSLRYKPVRHCGLMAWGWLSPGPTRAWPVGPRRTDPCPHLSEKIPAFAMRRQVVVTQPHQAGCPVSKQRRWSYDLKSRDSAR